MIKKLFILTGFLFFTITVAQSTTHTVSQGDTAYSISKKYGLTLNQLFQLNPSVVEGKIAIGDVLKVKSDAKNAPIEAASNGTLGTIIVQPKQTVYGITKKFKISESDLKKWNPLLESEGLKIGSQLSLPKDKIKKFADPQEMILPINTEAKVVNTTIHPTDEFVSYTVENGDTIFSLVSKFGTTIDELTTWNPTLSQGLKSGMSLKVKKMEAAYKKKNNDALNVVLMLPFGYNSNDTKYRSVSMDFLTGAKLAIERNVKAGMKLEVIVVDAGNEQSFKSSLSQINVNNTDLIIGPFFKSSVLDALDYVGDKKILLV
jgi:LysM repeat protein